MRLALRAAALALAAAGLACPSPEERAARHAARAEELVLEKRVDDALLELQTAQKLDPRSAAVNQRLAELFAEKGAVQRAVVHFGEAYRLDPDRVEAALRQASLLWKSNPKRAERIVLRAKQSHPEEPAVFRTEAALALVLGDLPRALASARQAVSFDRTQRESWMQLGSVHRARVNAALERGEAAGEALASALAAYAEVEALAAGDVGARVATARVLASWPNRRDDTVAAFRSALALAVERNDSELRRMAATALERFARRQRDRELQREALRHQVAAAPQRLDSWERLAAVAEQLDGTSAGEAVLRELIQAWPKSPVAHIAYSANLARIGRPSDAIAHLEQVIGGGLDEPLLWEQVVRLEIAERRLREARAHLDELAQRHRGDPVTRRAEARLALAEGRADGAAELLRDFEGPRADAESEALRAQIALSRGRIDEAVAAADRAVGLAPGFSASAQRLKAAVHAEAKEWPEALAALGRIQSRGLALSAADSLIRVRALYGQGDRERARSELALLLARPDAAPAAALEFARQEGAGDPNGARSHLERAHERAPANVPVLEALTRIDLRAEQPDRALARLDRVVASQRTGARVLLLRAEVLARAGHFERAEADALRAFEAAPDLPRAVDLLFAIYAAQNKLDDARRSFEEAEAAGVLHGGARMLLGRLYLERGEVDKAQATYERVIQENPEIAPAKNDLAFMLASRGSELERALRLAEDAQRALPDSPNAADTVGYVYLRLGRHEAALQQLIRAIERAGADDPSLPTFHYHLGLALARLARPDEAAAHFEKALALDPNFPGAADARQQLAAPRTAAAPIDGPG